MHAQCLYDWDRLAEVWDLFEDKGFSPELLAPVVDQLRTPVAVVGCGRGVVLEHFQRKFGPDGAMGFDISEAMVKAATSRGCVHVYLAQADDPIPEGFEFGSILVATGVLDPLESEEIGALCHALRRRLADEGELWIYAFGKLGPNWAVAQTLAATHPLGIANHLLFDLYEDATRTSTAALLRRLGLKGHDALMAKVWLAGIDRLVKTVSAARASPDSTASLAFVRTATPSLNRRFDSAELMDGAERGGLQTLSLQTYEREGVLRLVCRRPSLS
jgi:Methyltransferase domain